MGTIKTRLQAIGVGLNILFALGCARPAARSVESNAEPLESGRARVVANARRATVTIAALAEGFWGDGLHTEEWTGSGFVIDTPRGPAIATAAHVARFATEMVATDYEGRRLEVSEIWAFDAEADVAVLGAAGLGATPSLPIAALPAVGGDVIIVSSPMGLGDTVAFGTVAAVRPTWKAFQLAAGVSPGSSGGLVADSEGRAVGVIRAKASADHGGENIAFAAPMRFVAEALANGHAQPLARPADPSRLVVGERYPLVTSVPQAAPGQKLPPQAHVLLPGGAHALEHMCATSDDPRATLIWHEAEDNSVEAKRVGTGRSCATFAAGSEAVLAVITEHPQRVSLTVMRQTQETNP